MKKRTTKEILSNIEHRPRALPTEKWKYYQEWNNAVFLHWQVDLNELKSYVPEGLEIDLFEGKPWVSLVAFRMAKIRLRNLPSFSPISDFDEINIRTYVKRGLKTGVYFLSIEGGNKISCRIAKSMSGLPYRYSNITGKGNSYCSENLPFRDSLEIRFDIGQELKEKTDLDKWLTERYVLFQPTEKSINEFEIHHVEWPTCNIELKKFKIEYPRFNKLMNSLPDRKHYSSGVQVLAWVNKKK